MVVAVDEWRRPGLRRQVGRMPPEEGPDLGREWFAEPGGRTTVQSALGML